MGTPDGFRNRKMEKEKWKRIIQPDGDSDSSIDCWEDNDHTNSQARHQRQLAAIRLHHFLSGGSAGSSRRMAEDQDAGPSSSNNIEPRPGPSSSPNDQGVGSSVVVRLSPDEPLHLVTATSSTPDNNTPSIQPNTSAANNISSSRLPFGRLTLRQRRLYPESMSFENRMQKVRERLQQRNAMRDGGYPTMGDAAYQRVVGSSSSPVLNSSLASLRSVMRCGNNPDWLKLSGQGIANRNPRGLFRPIVNTDRWSIATPPQDSATNLSVPVIPGSPEPAGNENPDEPATGSEANAAQEPPIEPVAGPSTETPATTPEDNDEIQAGPSAPKRPRTDADEEQASQTMNSLSDLALNSSILSMLECPVCLDHMGPPIHQCRRGHLVCNSCRVQLIQCPTCRSRFTDLRNLALERIAEFLHFPCKNEECGQSFKLRSKDDHELNCPWRTYKCMAHNCQWQGLHQSLLTHVQETHGELILIGNTHQLDLPIDMHFIRNYVFYAWGELFRANLQRGPGTNTIHCLAQYLGPVARAAQFRFLMKLEQTDSNGVSRNLSYERTMHPDSVRPGQAYAVGDCFCINIEQVKHFMIDRKVTLQVTLDKVAA